MMLIWLTNFIAWNSLRTHSDYSVASLATEIMESLRCNLVALQHNSELGTTAMLWDSVA